MVTGLDGVLVFNDVYSDFIHNHINSTLYPKLYLVHHIRFYSFLPTDNFESSKQADRNDSSHKNHKYYDQIETLSFRQSDISPNTVHFYSD
jgi:hypothetical protein